jgi:Alr-MurF fusion protein
LNYQLKHIASIVGATPSVKNDLTIEHLLLDSRRVYAPATSLFFALKGPRRDGHQFIPELYKRGVRAFIISEALDTTSFPEAAFLLVKDTLTALQELAAHHRKQFDIPVIGITGSNGKTIVKEWLYQLLNEDFNIVRSPKSYNSQIGVPLSVWQMNEQNTLAIFEAGISKPDEMEKLAKIIQPTIGVVTNIGEAHNEGFASSQQKINEKIRLLKGAQYAIFNVDNAELSKTINDWWEGETHATHKEPFKMIGWGEKKDAVFQITGIKKAISSTIIEGVYNKEKKAITIPFTDDASIENAITCCCVLFCLNIWDKIIAARMKQLQPINMRLELKKGINNCSVINDSYSADLSSLNIALNFLDNQSAGTKKVVVLSDFLQSGLADDELYQQITVALQNHAVNKIIGITRVFSNYRIVYPALPVFTI